MPTRRVVVRTVVRTRRQVVIRPRVVSWPAEVSYRPLPAVPFQAWEVR